jgi:hypothetical protein
MYCCPYMPCNLALHLPAELQGAYPFARSLTEPTGSTSQGSLASGGNDHAGSCICVWHSQNSMHGHFQIACAYKVALPSFPSVPDAIQCTSHACLSPRTLRPEDARLDIWSGLHGRCLDPRECFFSELKVIPK